MKIPAITILLTAVLAAVAFICSAAAGPTVTFTRSGAAITLGGKQYALTEVFADADGDGEFNAGDARYILRLSAKLENYDNPEYFDISGDGALDAADARIALRYTAKLDRIYTDADGKRPSGLYTDENGKVYAFTDYGSVAAGLFEADGKRFWFDPTTAEAVEKIMPVNGRLYYFKADGSLFTGKAKYNGQSHSFTDGVEKKSGLVSENGNVYYYTDSGELYKDGWLDLRGRTYYFNPDGRAAAGLTKINDSLYFFEKDGAAASETFKTVDGNTYYFGPDNAAESYFFMVGNDLYYFDPDTFVMAKDTVIDDYIFGSDGRAINSDIPGPEPGPEDPDPDPEQEPYTPDAVTLKSAIYKRAKEVVKAINLRTPEDVFAFVKSKHIFTYNVEDGALYSHAQIEKIGWTHFAEYAFDNTPAICYYYAAEYAILLDAMGIKNRIVHGTGHYDSEHYWNQAMVGGTWVNYDACNGYCAVDDDYLKKACILNDRYEGIDGYTFGEYIYPVFK